MNKLNHSASKKGTCLGLPRFVSFVKFNNIGVNFNLVQHFKKYLIS